MNGADQQRLKQAIQQKRELAAKALLIDRDTQRAQAHLAWIETAQRVLPAEPPKVWRKLGPVLTVAGLCLLLAALAASLHPSSNPIRLEAEAESIGFTLTQAWRLESAIPVTHIDAREITSVSTSQHGDRKAQQMRVKASSASLEKLAISAGAVLELESTPEGWRLFLSQGAIAGDIMVSKGTLQVDGGPDEVLQSKPGGPQEVLRFSGKRTIQDAVPLRLDIAGKPANGKLAELAVTDLRFSRQLGTGTGQWISTLISAKGKFQHQADAFELAEGDELQLVDAQSQRFALLREGDHLKALFHGTVGRLSGGPQAYVEELTPTWLDVVTHHKKIVGLWAAVAFLWPLAIWFRGL
jgi:hypothetical protein